MLNVKIKKNLGSFVLDVDIETEKDVLGLLGASGSGKSMTLKCIAGIEKPEEGKIVLNGKVLFDSEKHINLAPQERHIAYLFQNYALFPNMTIFENIFVSANVDSQKSPVGVDPRSTREIKNSVANDVIEKLGLSGLEKKYPHEISGGQQQRVALARILVNEPEFLLLDEPFSSIDAYLKWNLAQELKKVIDTFGKGVIFVSHNINEVYFLCKNAIIIDNGSVIEKGEVLRLIDKPINDVTKNLVKYSDFSRDDIDKIKQNMEE